MEIGGDWFDAISSPDGGFIFVVGDVSGRGMQAAVVMASLRFAILAYAADGDRPSQILKKLCLLRYRPGTATSPRSSAVMSTTQRTITLSSAGPYLRSWSVAGTAPLWMLKSVHRSERRPTHVLVDIDWNSRAAVRSWPIRTASSNAGRTSSTTGSKNYGNPWSGATDRSIRSCPTPSRT